MGIAVSQEFAQQSVDASYVDIMRDEWMPWLLDGLDLGDDVLALVVGPGVTTSSVFAPGRRVTVGQAAPAFTAEVTQRFATESAVEVVDADPWQLPFPDGRFSAVIAVLMLHHVPTAQLQDQTLREIARVLRPGGLVAGLNALDGPHFRRMNTSGASVPVEPLAFPQRLRDAGFVDVTETVWSFVRFTGRAVAGGAR